MLSVACDVGKKSKIFTGLPRLERLFKARNDTGFIFRLPKMLIFRDCLKRIFYQSDRLVFHCKEIATPLRYAVARNDGNGFCMGLFGGMFFRLPEQSIYRYFRGKKR